MIKLSEIIKTDCYIDCGSNEKLREVVSLIESKYKFRRWLKLVNIESNYKFRRWLKGGSIEFDDVGVAIFSNDLEYITAELNSETKTPTHHISQIDLNN